jgi:Domain of unknown function (DUF6458)
MGFGVGIFLTAIGAILAFAVNVDTGGTGINVHTVGLILLAVGILGIILSMVFWSSWGGFGGRRRSTTTTAPGAPVAPGSTTTTVDQP